MKEVLLVTWHGIHELEIYPGLPDTGGQNIYVQNMAEMIHDYHDCRVTILNRGGYAHPYTGRLRDGFSKDSERELYVLHASDSIPAFVRKEFLTPALIENAFEDALKRLQPGYRPDLIISHFWDGGIMGHYLQRHFGGVPHIWVPHEPVGIKKAPLPESHYDRHSIYLRDVCERRVMENATFVGSTSKLVRDDLRNSYAGAFDHKIIDIFPGVDTKRFRPSESKTLTEEQIGRFARFLDLPVRVFTAPRICEFGRSDSLKRKEKAVEAFARICREVDDVVMFTNIDAQMEPKIAMDVARIIRDEGIADRVVVLSPRQLPQSGEGSDLLPDLMRTSRAFLTMSEMEGFGMAACEAAACAVPVVGTNLIPVLTDVIEPAGGGMSVGAGDTEAAARALLEILRMDEASHAEMSKHALDSVIPGFTWHSITKGMFDQVKVNGQNGNGNG